MPSKKKTQQRQYLNLPTRKATLPFSDAVLVGDTLYVAGRIGIDPETGLAPPEVAHELELLFADFKAVLGLAGMTLADLVSVQIFAPDVSLWESFNREYLKHFSNPLPARAFIGSGPLLKNGRFEMMGIATRSS
jgi:2-iminobutanoate/2-iminopropanoate deaminase